MKYSRQSGQEDRQYSISLLFNANKVYDRQVIEGIGHYLQSSQVDWDVYLEEDCLARLNNLDNWDVDGIIADFDDPHMQAALADLDIPIIGVGGSYRSDNDYPNVPYVKPAGSGSLKNKNQTRNCVLQGQVMRILDMLN